MRNFFATLIAGVSVASASNVFNLVEDKDFQAKRPVHQTFKRNGFGMAVEQVTYENQEIETTVKAPLVPFLMDFDHQTKHMENASKLHRDIKEGYRASPNYTCNDRLPFGSDTSGLALLPAHGGKLNAANPQISFEGKCFSNITMDFAITSETTFDVTIQTSGSKSLLCNDVIMLGNTEIQHVEIFYLNGKHTMHFEMNNTESQDDIALAGIDVFNFCDTGIEDIESLWNTLKMFVGGLTDHPDLPVIGSHVPKYMEAANVKFIHDALGVTLEERETKTVDIDPSLIQSGDFFGVMRLDGLDQIIMYGTGAYIGHNVMALRMEDDELYILESQDAWYWPTHGLQRTKWADWIKQAEDASFHVTWHRMRDDVRATFDTQKAADFFAQTEGMPYGYYNFLYGWIDTAEDNWPPMLAKDFVPVMFSILQKIVPDTVYTFFSEALNRRLGTDGLNIQGVVEAAYQKNMTIDEVMAMVEQDGWRYFGKPGDDVLSYVCSAYVAAIYKAAGVFGDLDINATEFATRDVYIMDLWDTTTPLPEACVAADPELPYCQLRGNYRVNLPDYNTITPYEHMFEHCEINYPTYERTPGC